MKKMDTILAELGFRKDAPQSVQEAFIKHLIKASLGVDVVTPTEKREKVEQEKQLEFDFMKRSKTG